MSTYYYLGCKDCDVWEDEVIGTSSSLSPVSIPVNEPKVVKAIADFLVKHENHNIVFVNEYHRNEFWD